MNKNMLIGLLLVALLLPAYALAEETKRVQLFGGYSYLKANLAEVTSFHNGPLFPPADLTMHGWIASAAYNVNNYLGMVVEVSGAYNGDTFSGIGPTTNRLTNALTGPRLTYRSRILQPFVHGLFGLGHGTFRPDSVPSIKARTRFAMALGGGLDVKVSDNVSLRLAQVDYFHTQFGTYTPEGNPVATQSKQHSFRLSTGIVIGLGRNHPPTVTCSIASASIKQDDTTAVRASAVDSDADSLTYTWSASGGKVTGTGDTVTFDATGVAPGKYTITVSVSDGRHQVDCSADVTVIKKNLAPTVSCSPSSVTVTAGDSATIRATASDPNNDSLTYTWTVNGQRLAADAPTITFGTEGRQPGTYAIAVTVSDGELTATCSGTVVVREKVRPNQLPQIEPLTKTVEVLSGSTVELRVRASDPDNDRLTITWSASEGTVRGFDQAAVFNATGLRAGTYTVTATADDGRGGRASCTMTVNVYERLNLNRDKGGFQPGGTRLDNVAKAALDDLAVRMNSNPRLVANLIGYTDGSRLEASRKDLGLRRAQAAIDYLKKKGIDESRLTATDGRDSNPLGDSKTAAGRARNRRVEVELKVR